MIQAPEVTAGLNLVICYWRNLVTQIIWESNNECFMLINERFITRPLLGECVFCIISYAKMTGTYAESLTDSTCMHKTEIRDLEGCCGCDISSPS